MSSLTDPIRVPADRTRIDVADPLEVRWWSRFLGCGEDQLLDAVSLVGDCAAHVESWLDCTTAGIGAGGLSDSGLRASPDEFNYVDRLSAGEKGRSLAGELRSCMLCGHAKPLSQLARRRLFGVEHLVCLEMCGEEGTARS